MKAVILAAGKGTRLGDLTKDIPKPMIRVAGKPVLEHIIGFIRDTGVNDFVLVTRYLSEKIEQYFGDGSDFGVSIKYIRQPDGKYGTGAALLAAKDLVQDEPLMMTYGDIIMSRSNYTGILNVYKKHDGAGAITVNWVGDPCTGADVKLNDEGRVIKIIEKPTPGVASKYLNSSGLFIFQPVIFNYLEKLAPSTRGEYELSDAMSNMVADGLALYPYYLEKSWRDVGRPEDITAAEQILESEIKYEDVCN